MIDRCREEICAAVPGGAIHVRMRPRWRTGGPFDVLLTNSLLHHLPDPQATIAAADGATRSRRPLAGRGHEPSSRYYKNPECLRPVPTDTSRAAQESVAAQYWWRGIFPSRQHGEPGGVRPSPNYESPKRLAARAPHIKQGLFGRRPTPHVIDRLVDFHVAHSAAEAAAGRGFDIDRLQAETARANGNSVWEFSYWYMGTVAESRLAVEWRPKPADDWPTSSLATAPNLCALWRRAA